MRFPGKNIKKYKKKRTKNPRTFTLKGRLKEEKKHTEWEKLPEVWKENREAVCHGGQGQRIFQDEGPSQCFKCCKRG